MIGSLGTPPREPATSTSAPCASAAAARAGRALMVLMLDDEPDAAALDMIAAVEGIASARLVRL